MVGVLPHAFIFRKRETYLKQQLPWVLSELDDIIFNILQIGTKYLNLKVTSASKQ